MKTFQEAMKMFHLDIQSADAKERIKFIQENFSIKYGALAEEIMNDRSTKQMIREIMIKLVNQVDSPSMLILIADELRAAISVAFIHGVVTGIEMEKEELKHDPV